MSPTVIAILVFLFVSIIDACTFNDQETGYVLDLTALAYTSIEHAATDGPKNYTYFYTPCRNGEACTTESGTNTGMFVRNDNKDNCEILANWDNGKTQPYYDIIDSTWSFEYKEDNACNNDETATFLLFFHCDEDAGDYRITHVGTMEEECQFEIYIDSIWGCPGMLTEGASSQLSPGTYFIIVLFAGLILYCIIGWIIGCLKNGKYGDFVSNIPHITFWLQLPSLVCAGCLFTKDFLMSFCCVRASHQPISNRL